MKPEEAAMRKYSVVPDEYACIEEYNEVCNQKLGFIDGANWMMEKALDILDDMFMEQSNISVDDWFRDSPNLFQGRETFIKRMMEE